MSMPNFRSSPIFPSLIHSLLLQTHSLLQRYSQLQPHSLCNRYTLCTHSLLHTHAHIHTCITLYFGYIRRQSLYRTLYSSTVSIMSRVTKNTSTGRVTRAAPATTSTAQTTHRFMCTFTNNLGVPCGKSFKKADDLRRHDRVHDGFLAWWCKLCNKGSKQKTHSITHVRTHLGEGGKVLTCRNSCGKWFADASQRAKHSKTCQYEAPEVPFQDIKFNAEPFIFKIPPPPAGSITAAAIGVNTASTTTITTTTTNNNAFVASAAAIANMDPCNTDMADFGTNTTTVYSVGEMVDYDAFTNDQPAGSNPTETYHQWSQEDIVAANNAAPDSTAHNLRLSFHHAMAAQATDYPPTEGAFFNYGDGNWWYRTINNEIDLCAAEEAAVYHSMTFPDATFVDPMLLALGLSS